MRRRCSIRSAICWRRPALDKCLLLQADAFASEAEPEVHTLKMADQAAHQIFYMVCDRCRILGIFLHGPFALLYLIWPYLPTKTFSYTTDPGCPTELGNAYHREPNHEDHLRFKYGSPNEEGVRYL